MNTYAELLAQKKTLDEQIDKARKAESAQALQTIQELVKEFGFTSQQVFPWKPEGKNVPAKYHDPQTGSSWSGRGKTPKWIADQDRVKFLIR